MRLAGACTLVILIAAGCTRSDDKKKSGGAATAGSGTLASQSNEELSAVLAKVEGVTITVKQLQDSINRQSPYIRARYQSKEQKRVFLDNLIRFEVLAKEAEKRGLDKDPEVVQTMKSAMITKLLKDELERGLKPEDIPEADMKAHFDAHQAEFNKPEEVRVSAVIVTKKAQADEVARQARAEAGKTNKAFRELVTKYSTDEESKLRGGDLRYFARESAEIPRPVVEAAFGLEKTGDVAGPIAADGKFYVIKQTGRRKAVVKTYDQVKRQIQNDLYKDRREASQKQFVEQLRAKAKVEVFEDNLKKVRVDTSQAAAEPVAPDPHAAPPPSPGVKETAP
ncbi:MAG TPA: peptidyl-prolyl cis-trans isomerase [Kofleriaceae bacterium]|nr:peptidyl-prolyl cis-trans isomerase [Kofleriaceae bacterium]